ncbi:hypothetical protein QA646_18855 (plasmid) [Rhizobium sp. CB3090]|uniref:hypothetical protein n=1 Tax=Rhizobium sp. CB3090 TaxID=3039156 RepID=UPI0024B17F13|nr:hypothetical protein [Rhizobium sp. CB3090]WFU12007.1 hypothetical protein QA646_18855 [Rhizobium sp. CB3090]
MSCFARVLLTLSIGLLPGLATADESNFLQSLQGKWSGKGTIIRRIGTSPIDVTCIFAVTASAPSLSMRGNCRALLVVSRAISADLRVNGQRYNGIYVGPSGGRSGLSGVRQGNTIDLVVHWAKEVNGDRTANMEIQKIGGNSLNLRTIDRDPKTGRSAITSDIALRRI